MAGNSNNNHPAHRQPAAVIGGQRRRLARRQGLPRSQTMPTLNQQFAAAQSGDSTSDHNAEGATTAANTAAPGLAESSQSSMNFYPPTGLVHDHNPVVGSAAHGTITSSPAPTSSILAPTKDGKKKTGFFPSFKIKDGARDASKHFPLPPSTPTKAAKILGVDVPSDATSPTAINEDSDDSDDYGDMPMRATGTNSSEQGREPNSSKTATGLQSCSGKKTKKMLASLASSFSRRPRLEDHELPNWAPFSPGRNIEEDFANHVSSFAKPPKLPQTPRREDKKSYGRELVRHSRYRVGKKSGKALQQMELVTETAQESTDDGEDDVEDEETLKLIEQYRKPRRPPPDMTSHALTNAYTPAPAAYRPSADGLAEKSLTEATEAAHEIQKTELETYHALSKLQSKLQESLKGKGKGKADDLQSELDSITKKLQETEVQQAELDAHVVGLKEEHEKDKKNLASMTSPWAAPADKMEDNTEDGDDDVSIRSSIDLDEEPTVHTATAMTITRVTPGMVKLVDIPARKKAPSAEVKKWVDAHDPAEQRPLSESVDADVLRDREQPPAPLPK